MSRATYAALYATIGTTWGAGDDATTFNLLDFRRRAPVDAGGVASSEFGAAASDTGGSETHMLTEAELPAHTHGSAGAHTHDSECSIRI